MPDKERLRKARDLWRQKIEKISGKKGKGLELPPSHLLEKGYEAAQKERTKSNMFVSTAADKIRLLRFLKDHLPVGRGTGPSQEAASETMAPGEEYQETVVHWPPVQSAWYNPQAGYVPDMPVLAAPQDVTFSTTSIEYSPLLRDASSFQRYQSEGLDLERSDPRLAHNTICSCAHVVTRN